MREMIETIRRKFATAEYEYSIHAADQSILRRIARCEIEQVIQNGEIIEEYPTDKYGPSMLVCGSTADGRIPHIQCTSAARRRVKTITVYEPDATEWIDFRKRRRK